MSEEALALSGIETVWATLVSAAPPHVMAAASAAGAAASAGVAGAGSGQEKKDSLSIPSYRPCGWGITSASARSPRRTITARWSTCTAPLVVTFVTLLEANVGAMQRVVALPLLRVLLEPVRRVLVRSQGGGGLFCRRGWKWRGAGGGGTRAGRRGAEHGGEGAATTATTDGSGAAATAAGRRRWRSCNNSSSIRRQTQQQQQQLGMMERGAAGHPGGEPVRGADCHGSRLGTAAVCLRGSMGIFREKSDGQARIVS